jgi:hypothetical protein
VQDYSPQLLSRPRSNAPDAVNTPLGIARARSRFAIRFEVRTTARCADSTSAGKYMSTPLSETARAIPCYVGHANQSIVLFLVAHRWHVQAQTSTQRYVVRPWYVSMDPSENMMHQGSRIQWIARRRGPRVAKSFSPLAAVDEWSIYNHAVGGSVFANVRCREG